eukprot:1175440-Prorocentrum_minimum.AAC.3
MPTLIIAASAGRGAGSNPRMTRRTAARARRPPGCQANGKGGSGGRGTRWTLTRDQGDAKGGSGVHLKALLVGEPPQNLRVLPPHRGAVPVLRLPPHGRGVRRTVKGDQADGKGGLGVQAVPQVTCGTIPTGMLP